MEKQNIIDGIRLIVIIGVFIFIVIGSYRNIINQNKVISTNTYIDKDNLQRNYIRKEEIRMRIYTDWFQSYNTHKIESYGFVHRKIIKFNDTFH